MSPGSQYFSSKLFFYSQPDNWNTVSAFLSFAANQTYKFQYSIYRTRKAPVERKFLFVPNLLWGTQVNLFSELFSLSLRRGNGDVVVTLAEEDRPRIVTFSDRIGKPQNQLHCVTWDRDLWNAIDCETDRHDEFEFASRFNSDDDDDSTNLFVTVNCTCQSGKASSSFCLWAVIFYILTNVLY